MSHACLICAVPGMGPAHRPVPLAAFCKDLGRALRGRCHCGAVAGRHGIRHPHPLSMTGCDGFISVNGARRAYERREDDGDHHRSTD
jgi:hypothetical protein